MYSSSIQPTRLLSYLSICEFTRTFCRLQTLIFCPYEWCRYLIRYSDSPPEVSLRGRRWGRMHNFPGIINEWYDASLALWRLLVNNSHVTAGWRWRGGLLAFRSTWVIDLLIHSVPSIHSLIQFPIHRLVANNRTSPINDKLLCWLKGGEGGGGVPGEDI